MQWSWQHGKTGRGGMLLRWIRRLLWEGLLGVWWEEEGVPCRGIRRRRGLGAEDSPERRGRRGTLRGFGVPPEGRRGRSYIQPESR